MRKVKSFLGGLGLVVLLALGLALWSRLPPAAVGGLLLVLVLWLLLTRRGQQALSVAGVGISTLGQRIGASSVIVIGIAGVVGVLVAMLAMGEGFQATLQQTGSNDTAIVLRGGSNAELNSVLERDNLSVIANAPGVARGPGGKPLASAELSVVANLPKKSDPGAEANVSIRGVGDEAWALRPNVKIVQGRRFKPGLRELVVGQGALRQFAGVEVGHQLRLAGQEWTIVGEFVSHDSHDSELWGDAQTVAAAYRRGSSAQSVTVRLTSPAAFDSFKAALLADPRLKVDVSTTREYYTKQSEGLTKVIRVVGITVGTIMAIGAIFGALTRC
ncbi:MAG: ABC transporter permease, partial [Rhodanobacter sp.]